MKPADVASERRLWWAVIEQAIDDLISRRPLGEGWAARLPKIRTEAYDFLYTRRSDLFVYNAAAGCGSWSFLTAWLDKWHVEAIAALAKLGPDRFATWEPWPKSRAARAFRVPVRMARWAPLIPHIAQVLVLARRAPRTPEEK